MYKLFLLSLALLLVSCTQTVVIEETYNWSKCYDNDTPSFSQEYMDNDTRKAFDLAESKYGNCHFIYQGYQGIVGCGGDFWNEFSCFKK